MASDIERASFSRGVRSRDDEIAALKVEVGLLTARAERAEAERDAAIEGDAAVFFSAEDRARTEAERDHALAANAELRAALDLLCRAVRVGEAHGFPEELHAGIVDEAIRGEAALSRTDLGRDVVVVPREVVDVVLCALLETPANSRTRDARIEAGRILRDALIKKGGG